MADEKTTRRRPKKGPALAEEPKAAARLTIVLYENGHCQVHRGNMTHLMAFGMLGVAQAIIAETMQTIPAMTAPEPEQKVHD